MLCSLLTSINQDKSHRKKTQQQQHIIVTIYSNNQLTLFSVIHRSSRDFTSEVLLHTSLTLS